MRARYFILGVAVAGVSFRLLADFGRYLIRKDIERELDQLNKDDGEVKFGGSLDANVYRSNQHS